MRRIWIFSFVLIFFIAGLLVYMSVFVNPVIINYSQAKIDHMTVKAVNRSIQSVVSTDIYRDLVDIRYDSAGKITSLTTDMVQMNRLSSDIAIRCQQEVDLLSVSGIAIPIGTFSGLPILTGKGPDTTIRVVPLGNINCIFESNFEEAGFNQTRHRIVLKVRSRVTLILPLVTRRAESEIDVLLCESIIIGEVPNWLWNR